LNWEFDSYPQIPLKQGQKDYQLEHVIHHWKDPFEGYKIFPLHAPNMFDLKKM
jgi:hypothetical protein